MLYNQHLTTNNAQLTSHAPRMKEGNCKEHTFSWTQFVEGRSRYNGCNERSMCGLIVCCPLTSTRHDIKSKIMLHNFVVTARKFHWHCLEHLVFRILLKLSLILTHLHAFTHVHKSYTHTYMDTYRRYVRTCFVRAYTNTLLHARTHYRIRTYQCV